MDTIADRPDTMTTTTSAERRSRRKATRASGPPGRSSVEVVTAAAPVSPEPDRTARRITSMWRRVRPGRIGFRRPAAVLAIVALLASVSVAGTAWHDHRRVAGNADHEAAIVEVARQGVTALINIRGEQADADFARLSAITAPPFSDELHDQS